MNKNFTGLVKLLRNEFIKEFLREFKFFLMKIVSFRMFPLDTAWHKSCKIHCGLSEMARRLKETRKDDRQYLYIDADAGMGRKILRLSRKMSKTISSSPCFFKSVNKRTHKFLNASFLPFFALLSIPPSFN